MFGSIWAPTKNTFIGVILAIREVIDEYDPGEVYDQEPEGKGFGSNGLI